MVIFFVYCAMCLYGIYILLTSSKRSSRSYHYNELARGTALFIGGVSSFLPLTSGVLLSVSIVCAVVYIATGVVYYRNR